MNPLQDVQDLFLFALTPGQVIIRLSVALTCGILIAWFYCKGHGRPTFARSFVSALVTLAMLTAVVIMVIENNLARAFGLVGAMSIIRFRTAVKDIQDIVFIFFSLAVGMAAGVGLLKIAFIGTLFVGLVTLGLSRFQIQVQKKREYLLQFSYTPEMENGAAYLPLFKQHCKGHNLINMKSAGMDGELDLAFYIRFKQQSGSTHFVQGLRQIDGVRNVNLFFDEEYS